MAFIADGTNTRACKLLGLLFTSTRSHCMLHEPWDGSADVLPQFAQQFKPADPFVSKDDLLSVIRKAARAAVKLPPEEQQRVQQESFAALRAVGALPLVQQCSSVAETHGVRVVVTTCNIPRTANEAGYHTYVYKVSRYL